MKQALFFEEIGHKKVQCHLCPHNCALGLNKRGNCRVRKNFDGKLISENFGLCSSIQFDPIEKNHCIISIRDLIFYLWAALVAT